MGDAPVPGDKSCSHRALILAAMAEGQSTLSGLLDSADIRATRQAIEAFGVRVTTQGEAVLVEGSAWCSPEEPIDCGNSGTSARLLIGAVAGMPDVKASFVGDRSLSRRPMRRLTAPLARMGAQIDGGEHLPLTVTGRPLGGITHRNHPASAQVKSAILFAGLGTQLPVRVIEPVPSRDHSEIMLAQFGCELVSEDGEEGWSTALGERRSLSACDLIIAADPSSAAFPLVAAAVVPGSRVRVEGMMVNPLRTGLYEALEQMGAEIVLSRERLQSGEIVADMTVAHGPLRPCRIDPSRVPMMIDEIPALAVACAFADGESVIAGLDELRHKESDRLGAIIAGLTACGVAAFADGDTLHIFGRGRVAGGARVATQGDHRMAMAFLALGLAAERPVEVDEAQMIGTSFPGFVETMRAIGADIG